MAIGTPKQDATYDNEAKADVLNKNKDTLYELQEILHSKPLNILTPAMAMHKAEGSSRPVYFLLFLQVTILKD